jgi:alginate O-acetyltransferase complex protein AlgI
MALTSLEFVLFFILVLVLRTTVRTSRGEKWLLLAASVAFYLSWSVPCILLILFTSIMDYSIGRSIGGTSDPVRRKRLLLVSLVGNLGILGFFKYTNFLISNVVAVLNAIGLQVQEVRLDIVLPPAISFFTFASLSYVLDIYYERISPCNSARDYTLFVTFFPKLLSGPIARAREFLPQLAGRVQPSLDDVEIGLARVLVGAVKKVVIADGVAANVNMIFATPSQFDAFTLAQGLLGYAVQLYCDFSGYSDMAIGCARILGYRVPENFQMPYSAATITEFWRRWHMTLSNWLRDYLFLPLEIATRNIPYRVARASMNVMITFVICGLWHGASWNFVLWGAIMGVALAVHISWMAWKPFGSLDKVAWFRATWTVASHVVTLGTVLLSFAFARTQTLSEAFVYIKRIITWDSTGTHMVSPYILPAVAAVVIVHLLIHKDRNIVEEWAVKPMPIRILSYSSLVLLLALIGASTDTPFIYFQF